MLRVAELARDLVREGTLGGVEFRPVPAAELQHAAEMLVVGTTRDVIAVREFDGRPVGDGKPGPVWKLLSERLNHDMHHNAALRTLVWDAAGATHDASR
jgi:branched-subunit amino acid aminotransferase/4-amino-4-deoxychorismate lyase